MGQPDDAKRTMAERIQSVVESAADTGSGGKVLTLRVFLSAKGNQTIRPRKGFKDRGGTGFHTGVPCGTKPERLIEGIVDGARP